MSADSMRRRTACISCKWAADAVRRGAHSGRPMTRWKGAVSVSKAMVPRECHAPCVVDLLESATAAQHRGRCTHRWTRRARSVRPKGTSDTPRSRRDRLRHTLQLGGEMHAARCVLSMSGHSPATRPRPRLRHPPLDALILHLASVARSKAGARCWRCAASRHACSRVRAGCAFPFQSGRSLRTRSKGSGGFCSERTRSRGRGEWSRPLRCAWGCARPF